MASSRPARRPHDRADRRLRLVTRVVASAALVLVVLGLFWWFRPVEPARDGAPNWFPDGRALVFAAEIGNGRADIYRMDLDGGGRRRLTDHEATDSAPAVSPDGTRIAFESDRGGNFDIYVMDVSGGNVVRLTSDPAADMAPAWSPDGRRIAFTSDRENRASADVYVMNADGSDVRRLTDDLANWSPQFSPDGQRIAVQVNRDVVVLDVADQARRQLTASPLNGMNPTWAPDGSRLAFVSTRGAPGRDPRAEIFTMNADGSDQRVLVSVAPDNAIDPRWSPTGTHIAFVLVPYDQPAPGEEPRPEHLQAIYIVDVASGVLTRVSP